ncbi:MAG: hypothetical protein JXM70_09500 [Pirellulales bacterium]|nr:hypothetical protein [Pirellulales bacterium]
MRIHLVRIFSLTLLVQLVVAIGLAGEPNREVVSPDKRTVACPPPIEPLRYEFDLKSGGGFTVKVKGREYRLESSYSYPHGGENRMLAGRPDTKGETTWKAKTEKLDEKNYRVRAAGKYYALDRSIEVQPTRVMVKDTFTNTSGDVVGIILDNHINIRGDKGIVPTRMNKLTAFVHDRQSGVGIIALDDLYQFQEKPRFADGLASLRNENFGLDKGASYTIEWAVYPTASDDYYDFINQVRKDEGLNRRVEGSFSFVPRRKPPEKSFMDLFNLKYISIGCLSNPPDDPTLGIEGIEFMEYPQECRMLKQTFAQTKRMYPDVKIMFHVAHGLYACNNPEKRFPDSRVIRADGKQIMYGGDNPKYYSRYFSKEKVEQGWRWWIFYPTMENSFGKAMLEVMHYMVDELGVTGMWADGFISGYAYVDGNDGGYSYDHWDGHSVDIDPKTKLILRKKTCVPWVALPVLVKVVRIIAAAGGVTLTNEGPDFVTPRSFWNEEVIASCEGSPKSVIALHLGRAPCSLSSAAKNAEESYRDILQKLEYGSLYFMYVHKMDHKTLLEHMYPITVESIHQGMVRGKERIVTKNSGVYSWPGDRCLHIVYRYDSTGHLAGNNFLSTADKSGVHTELRLEKDESAAVVRIPVEISSTSPVNLNVRHYDADGLSLALNGRGEVSFRLKSDKFVVKPGTAYQVRSSTSQNVVAGDAATLEFSLTLAGPTTLEIDKQ